VHAAYAVTVLSLIRGASPLARSAMAVMALDFEAVAISMIAAGETFRIAALPMAFKPKGSKKGTLVQGAGACIGRPLYVWPVSGCVVVVGGGLGMPGQSTPPSYCVYTARMVCPPYLLPPRSRVRIVCGFTLYTCPAHMCCTLPMAIPTFNQRPIWQPQGHVDLV
jgi:hypothetical protein